MTLGNKSFGTSGGANLLAFGAVHLVALAALWGPVTKTALALGAASFLLRKFGITAGYHRYFSHRSYKTSRLFQWALAWLGASAAQKGPLWWAAHHRVHHQESDGPRDIHSPARDGFWWAHLGWILDTKYDETNWRVIPDFARYPELRWLNAHFLVPPVLWAAACLALGGVPGLVWGFFVATTVLWHSTFLINSACHLIGRRRFPTRDTSRNSALLALITLGEGWHNNHHYYPSSVNQGFYWWEFDVTFYLLLGLESVGLVRDLRRPPARVLARGRGTTDSPAVFSALRPAALVFALLVLPGSEAGARSLRVSATAEGEALALPESRWSEWDVPAAQWAGRYERTVEFGDDDGEDQWLEVSAGTEATRLTFSRRSWNDSPADPDRVCAFTVAEKHGAAVTLDPAGDCGGVGTTGRFMSARVDGSLLRAYAPEGEELCFRRVGAPDR